MIMQFIRISSLEVVAATSLTYLDRIFDDIMVHCPSEESINFKNHG